MKLSTEVLFILNSLTQQGYEAYAVGGCVRDSLLGIQPKDWDVCTSAKPEEVIQTFSENTVIETGLQHGTVTVIIDQQPIEITTYRVESDYLDNRRPSEVEFVNSLRKDLARRDFTINALAYNPQDGIIDYYNGKSDLERGTVRCVGNPDDRIKEDALRILRALRFASQYDFHIDESLSDSIHKLKNLLSNISSERIQSEFNKILTGKNAVNILSEYRDVISVFIPEIKAMFGFNQNNPYHYLDVWGHTLESVRVASVRVAKDNLVVKLVMFFHDIGKPDSFFTDECGISHFYKHPQKGVEITRRIMNRLRYSNKMTSDVLKLIQYHDILLTEGNILRWMNRLGEDGVGLLLDVMTADIRAQSPEYLHDRLEQLKTIRLKYNEIIEENRCFRLKDLAIDGQDLIKMGYPPGKEIGAILKMLLDAVIDEDVSNDKDTLIRYLNRFY